jgi:phage terminase small subunit
MPRQAAASRPFSVNGSTRALLKPPADLDQIERAAFADLIAGTRADHFVPSDAALLACLAKNIVLERVAFGELRAAGYVTDRPSPWLAVLQHATRSVTTLSRMLSLSPAGRLPTKPTEPELAVNNHYTRMAMEQKRDTN